MAGSGSHLPSKSGEAANSMTDTIDRFSRSWQLIRASATLLRSEPRLLVLPLLSGIATVSVGGMMVYQAFDYGTFEASESFASMPAFYAWLFAFYMVQYFIIYFFNTALVAAAMDSLYGGTPTIGRALALAGRRVVPILGYAIMSATIGVLLRALAERAGFIGRLIAGGIGLAWTVATFLVVPIIAAEGLGPIEAVEKSATLLKKTWGENLIGNAGIALVVSVAVGGVFAIGYGGGTLLHELGKDEYAVPLMIVCGLLLIPLLVVGSALSGIYAAAVYYFAVLGKPPEGFDRTLVRDTFSPKS